MSLLHQDNTRGGPPSRENRRSLADFIGLDTLNLTEPPPAPPISRLNNEYGGETSWRWEDTPSPATAEAPRTNEPSEQQTVFARFSVFAPPGENWTEDPGPSLKEVLASLKALTMPSAPKAVARPQSRDFDNYDRSMLQWPPEQSAPAPKNEKVARRASFCGVITHEDSGCVVWRGTIPPRCRDPSGGFSSKVFVGGLPWDITEQGLLNALNNFTPVRVEWPGGGLAPRGFAYVTFESERNVRALLTACRLDYTDWYFRISSRKMRSKEVQVIPWAVSDSNWVQGGSVRLEVGRTVFVGALHGMLSASALATIMNDLFGGVVYAGIDTDKNKYPIGSGRVTFNNMHSYLRAIFSAYIHIKTDKFTKKVQIDPYLEDSMCSICNLHQGPYFCRNPNCFVYFCRSCWNWQHSTEPHKPMTRNSKSAHPALFSSPNGNAQRLSQDSIQYTNGPNEGATPAPSTNGNSQGSEASALSDPTEASWNPR